MGIIPPTACKGYAHERKRIDPLILSKMLILQKLFNLGD